MVGRKYTLKFECPRCKSKNVELRVEVPWSTNGLMPRQKIYLECKDCGFSKSLENQKESR
jgi:transcription elongation factor Elf1